jgi:amphi-Trp domain-containing protein
MDIFEVEQKERFTVYVPDEVELKIELEVESDERELEIELTW